MNSFWMFIHSYQLPIRKFKQFKFGNSLVWKLEILLLKLISLSVFGNLIIFNNLIVSNLRKYSKHGFLLVVIENSYFCSILFFRSWKTVMNFSKKKSFQPVLTSVGQIASTPVFLSLGRTKIPIKPLSTSPSNTVALMVKLS